MTDLLLIAVAAATVNNLVLVRLLGLSPVLDSGSSLEEFPTMALATTGVVAVTVGFCHAIDRWVLVPYDLPYLRILGFLGMTLLTIQAANLILQRRGRRLPRVTTASVALGVALLATGTSSSLAAALALGLGAGAGFSLVVLLFTGLRPRLEHAPVPSALRGPAIALVTVGMMSLAFLGFSGLGT
jgi:electron transport complex protein RnfA